MTQPQQTDIAIIGAGPAGSTAAALLRQSGWRVTVVERSHFPRFSIGDSLLPQCMEFLHKAGLLEAVKAAAFQVKNGVRFVEGDQRGHFDFSEQHSNGWDWTWNVVRADFDQILATQAAAQGADIRFGESITAVDFGTPGAPRLHVATEDGEQYAIDARFVCDASGFGRVLSKLLDLQCAVDAPPRATIFTHIMDNLTSEDARDGTLLCIHPQHPDVWYWMIPFQGGRTSVGVVGDPELINAQPGEPLHKLQGLIAQEPNLAHLLAAADYDHPVTHLSSYAKGVTRLHGRDFVLLGNAGGFLDPMFSSGVTIALKSSVLASALIDRQLRGQAADWDTDFATPLRTGIRVFDAYIRAWYAGQLKHVFFKDTPHRRIRSMIGSILAGYVWDQNNPYVARPQQRLQALCHTCAPAQSSA